MSTPSSNSSGLSPRRLHIIIVGLWLSLFMGALDGTIVTTALFKISSGFNALQDAGWIVITYLLTYNSFLMITAKLTDVWGIRAVLLTGNAVFFIFSLACGFSRTINQLIIFRAFQGIGGSAMYSLVFVTVMKLITAEKMGLYSGVISSVFAIANLLGPILGGVITDTTTWRWIFWINGPIVATAIVILFLSMPNSVDEERTKKERLASFDIIGAILSVAWPIPLLFALQEGGGEYAWNSGVIIGTLTSGLAALFIFGFYETWITLKTKKDAIFPVKFLSNPSMSLLLLSMFLLGMPFYMSIITLPQRFQSVNFTTAARAGILLLPLTLLTPVGALLGGVILGKTYAAEWVLIFGTALVTLSAGLIGTLPITHTLPASAYGFEILMGLGLGITTPVYFFLLKTTVPDKDLATGTGALNMLRTLGGCVGVALSSALLHSDLHSSLSAFLSHKDIDAVNESIAAIAGLSPQLREKVGEAFGRSYNKQFEVMVAFAGANFLVAVALAVVRKRRGVFMIAPEELLKREENVVSERNTKGPVTPQQREVEEEDKKVESSKI